MQITYFGHSCFKIKSKNSILITDPFDKYIGFSMPNTEADIVTVSHDHRDHNCFKQIGGSPFVIKAPGEYEIADISVLGFSSYHDKVKGEKRGKNTIYVIRMEEVSLCHLGDLGDKLTEKQLEEINGIDILFIPIGGVYTLDPKEAVTVINQVEPKIVIPMHYKVSGLNSSFDKLATLKDFLQEISQPEIMPEKKLVVSKISLPHEEERQIIPLTRK